jgi:hypothetical protein
VCIASLAAVAALAKDSKSQAVTVAGEVVDAACYMIHPQSATGPGHQECAKACADRGVPLAILNDNDKKLYFPAEGNKQLYKFIGQRVRGTGTAVDKSEPMVLSMPVGEKNKLSVKVEGGYKVLTIASIASDLK